MEESGPHKQSILRNKEVPKKNAPHKPRDVTRPTVMVKRLGFRGTLPVKYKIDFWNNPITASILVWNQVVLNQSQQLGYLNSKLMLSWDCPFNPRTGGGVDFTPPPVRFFPDSEKTAARSAAKFAIAVQPTIWHISEKKTMTRWPQRSRDQVAWSDLTSSCVFRSLTSCQRHTSDPNSLKLAMHSKGIGVYNFYISDFLYRWPKVMSISWPPHYKSMGKKLSRYL